MAIKAVVLDEAIIFRSTEKNVELHAGADKLLIRLQYSGLFLGLFSRSGLLASKCSVLEEIGVTKALLPLKRGEARGIASRWNLPGESCLFVCGDANSEDCKEFIQAGWSVANVDRETQLGSVPFIIAKLNMKALDLSVVGHCMKWSREKDLLQRGAMPIFSANSSLAFVGIDLHSPLERQVDLLHVVLNKATDEIVSVSEAPSDPSHISSGWIKFSESFQKLESCLSTRPGICIVDPTDRVMPLMDRVATQKLLQSLPHIQISGGATVRPPHFLKVMSFEEPELASKLKTANVNLPTIVKPQIACGASESHTMAVVFEEQGYSGLLVPLPAIVQEYIDHQSTIYKFYVLGKQVFFSTRKSTPDSAVLRTMVGRDEPAIMFDSLKSLPTGESSPDAASKLDIVAMKSAAAVLRETLGLTIIGFDVVVQAETGDHVIVDVNYFPTFKDVPDAEAVPAFWKALEESRARWIS